MIKERIIRAFLTLMAIMPVFLIFHENIYLQLVAVGYVFLIWLMIRKPSRKEDTDIHN